MEEKLTPKIFLNKVLAGTATGIIVGLIPNAVLAAILKLFGENTLAVTITQMAVSFQLATPLLIQTNANVSSCRCSFRWLRCCEIQS